MSTGLALLLLGCEQKAKEATAYGIIMGQVLDEVSGKGVSLASITTHPATSAVLTDQKGRYVIDGVPPGVFEVEAIKHGYISNKKNVAVTANKASTINIQLLTNQTKVCAISTEALSLDGVKAPVPGDITYTYGGDTLLDRYDGKQIIPPSGNKRWAVWYLKGLEPGEYDVLVKYAAADSRPLRLFINGNIELDQIAEMPTGSWLASSRKEVNEGRVRLYSPNFELRIESVGLSMSWPHFNSLCLVRTGE